MLPNVALDAAKVITGGGGAGGGIMSKVGDLFKNKQFLQMLGAAGQDMFQGTGGTNTMQSMIQSMTSGNLMNMLGQMLGGKDMKVTMDSEGFKISGAIPQQQAGGGGTPGGGIQPGQPVMSMGPGSTGTTAQMNMPGNAPTQPVHASTLGSPQQMFSKINPFDLDLSAFSASDLAGLSPEHIFQALNFAQSKGEFEKKKLTDIVDTMYKSKLMEQIDAQAIQGQQRLEHDQNKLAWDIASHDDRTAMTKEYEYAQAQGYEGSLVDFKNEVGPADLKLFQAAVKDGSWDSEKRGGLYQFLQARDEARRASTTVNVGPYETALEKARAEARVQLYNPESFAKAEKEAADKLGISEKILFGIDRQNPENRELVTSVIDEAIKNRVAVGNGTIVERGMSPDGRYIGYVVRWILPNGEHEEEFIQRAIY